jgi:hypothetical protein
LDEIETSLDMKAATGVRCGRCRAVAEARDMGLEERMQLQVQYIHAACMSSARLGPVPHYQAVQEQPYHG